jgi:hypothetical protein
MLYSSSCCCGEHLLDIANTTYLILFLKTSFFNLVIAVS